MPIWPRDVYLDHNATTPVAPEVRRAMERALRRTPGNPSSLHTQGRAAKGIVERARESVAALLGCPPERLFFTSGGTEGNNAVIKGVYARAGKGHIITSKIEHESILGACHQAEEAGARVTYVPAGRDGLVRAGDVRAAVRPDTILISIMHGNNETGAIQPVREVAEIARAAGIPYHTDAVQTYGKIKTLVDDIGCEFLTLSSHKINGPKGCGAVYWRGNTKW
jgi:cysteine desulfurase